MHSLLVDREGWVRKPWIGEGEDWDDDFALETSRRVEDRGSALRAEPERGLGCFIPDANELFADSRDHAGV